MARSLIVIAYGISLAIVLQLLYRAVYLPLALTAIIATITIWPEHRYRILAFSPLLGLFRWNTPYFTLKGITDALATYGLNTGYAPVLIYTATLLIAIGFCSWYRHLVSLLSSSSSLRKHRFAVFLLFYFLAILALHFVPAAEGDIFWVFLMTLSSLVLYLGFDLQSLDTPRTQNGFSRITFYAPPWRTYFIAPIKGESYLSAVESKTAPQFAMTQFKGLKLIVWGCVQLLLLRVFEGLAFGQSYAPSLDWLSLHVPHTAAVLPDYAKGRSLSVGMAWAVIYCEFFAHMLLYSVYGCVMVSLARMAGFDAFRNTYRPFRSRSFREFFGRYNFYYKEMLLHLFFYPTYFKYFRDRPRARFAFATFASAGLGNFLAIIIRDTNMFRDYGLTGASKFHFPYFIYCLFLAIVMSASINGDLKSPERCESRLLARTSRLLLIVTFFAVLRVFDDTFDGDIRNNFALFLNLFGL